VQRSERRRRSRWWLQAPIYDAVDFEAGAVERGYYEYVEHRRRGRVDDRALTPGRPQAVVGDLPRTTGESALHSMLLGR